MTVTPDVTVAPAALGVGADAAIVNDAGSTVNLETAVACGASSVGVP